MILCAALVLQWIAPTQKDIHIVKVDVPAVVAVAAVHVAAVAALALAKIKLNSNKKKTDLLGLFC